MSVHGEYSRALRQLRERLDERGAALAERHREALDAAQVTPARDLSTAARAALAVLARLEGDPALTAPDAPLRPTRETEGPVGGRPATDGLRDACHHLRAHCRAILGPAAIDR
jgi:uncharacterized membrane protein YccC